MKIYEMKYMYDWSIGTCLWSINEAAIRDYNYPVDINELPISNELREMLIYLIYKHDEALNWDNHVDELLWSKEEIEKFSKMALAGYEKLCQELADD